MANTAVPRVKKTRPMARMPMRLMASPTLAISSTVMRLESDTPALLDEHQLRDLQRRGALAAEDRQRLLEAGFRWLMVYPQYRPRRGPPIDRAPLEACLGPMLHDSDDVWLFDLQLRAGVDCEPVGKRP